MEIAYMLAYSPRSASTVRIPDVASAAAASDELFPPGIFDGECSPPSPPRPATHLSTTLSRPDGSLHPGYVNGGYVSSSVSPTRLPTDAASSTTTTLTSLPAYSASFETETSSVSTRPPDDPTVVVVLSTSVDGSGALERDVVVLPSTHHRDHRRRRARSTQRSQQQQRQRSSGGDESDATERGGAGCSRCCRYKGCSVCCARCMFIATSVRFMLVSLAIFGTGSVVVGIGLGALNMVVGNNFLTLSLVFIGIGITMVIFVGVLWRCVPTDHEPCHRLLHIEHRLPAELYGVGVRGDVTSQTGGGNALRFLRTSRNVHQWSGGIIYPEFNYGAPPPTYDASIVDGQPSFDVVMSIPGMVTTTSTVHGVASDVVIDLTADERSLPSSTPPSYRSRASSVRTSRQRVLDDDRSNCSSPIDEIRADRTDDEEDCISPPEYQTSCTNLSLERANDFDFEELREGDDDDDDCVVPDNSTIESSVERRADECQVKDMPSAAADESPSEFNSPEVAPACQYPVDRLRCRRPFSGESEESVGAEDSSVPPLRQADSSPPASRRELVDRCEKVPDMVDVSCDVSRLNVDELVEHL